MTPPKVEHTYRAGTGWGFMRWMDIPDRANPEQVYLRRLIVFKTPLVGIYLHWIFTPDNGGDPHNHPMNFWSLVLKGGYVEDRYWPFEEDGVRGTISHERTRRRFSLARTTTRDFHDIRQLFESPTVTLLLTGRRSQDWGFLTPEGFVPQTEYRARLGEGA